MTSSASARRLAEEFAEIGARLGGHSTVDGVLSELTETACKMIPHTEHAATSLRRGSGFVTIGATSDIPLRVDRIQYDLGSGPCVDAVLSERMFNAGDLRTDERWPEFGRRAAEQTGILSMLSFRLFFETDRAADLQVGLNLYASKPDAFDEDDETLAILISTHGALAVTAADAQERAEGMAAALQSNRTIGAALGILMSTLLITNEQAFDLLRVASQTTNRKLRDIAQDVIETGTLRIPDPPSDPRP